MLSPFMKCVVIEIFKNVTIKYKSHTKIYLFCCFKPYSIYMHDV